MIIFKHQLPAPLPPHKRPLLASSCSDPVVRRRRSSKLQGVTAAEGTLVAVGVGARRVLLLEGDCRLATVVVPAPHAITAVAFLGGVLLLGCDAGLPFCLPLAPLLKKAPARHGEVVCATTRWEKAAALLEERGPTQRLLPVGSGRMVVAVTGGDGSSSAPTTAVLLGSAEQVASAEPLDASLLGGQAQGDEPGAWACLDGEIAARCVQPQKEKGAKPAPVIFAATSSGLRWQRCDGIPGHANSSTGELPAVLNRVLALLPLPSGLLLVEETGRVARLVAGAWQWAPRGLLLPPGECGRVIEALLLRDGEDEGDDDDGAVVLAYRTRQGSVWVARLAELNGHAPPPCCGRPLDLAPDAVALTGVAASALFVLTHRGRLVCIDARGALPPRLARPTKGPQRQRRPRPASGDAAAVTASATAMDFAEEEALVREIEAAARATQAERGKLAATEAALERLRSAWAVVAGRGLLAASLDLEHESSGPPRLWVRLQNPTEGEALTLRGWSLLLRLEPAVEAPAPGLLLRRGRQGAGGVMAGGSWPLDDLAPGEKFQASLPLPSDVVASPLPVTARLALCLPFAAAEEDKEEDQGSWPAGICLELGSRPLDLLDLARAPRRVPATPAELRALEAQALATREYDRALASLLLASKQDTEEAEDEGAQDAAVAPSPVLPRPVVSSALKLLWPVGVGEDGQPAPLPGLSDLMGACDGARMGEGGRDLAIEAPGGRVLVARLLLGAGDGASGGGGGGGEPTVIVEDGAVLAVALQLTLSATDGGLLGLLKAACLQRLGPGAAVRTRRLALTQARMRALERAHHETTALAEALAAGEAPGDDEEGARLRAWAAQAARAIEVAVGLGREMDEACLLDLRPPPEEGGGMEVVA